jgi:peroxiredoxin Q/BCP
LKAFRELDAEVFGVNPGSEKSHLKFIQKNGFTFPLLLDEGGKVTQAYGARRDLIGGTQRSVYLIDKQGLVRSAWRGSPPDSELLETLRLTSLAP